MVFFHGILHVSQDVLPHVWGRFQLVSRLDQPTSGVLPLALGATAELLRAQFTAGLVEKAAPPVGSPLVAGVGLENMGISGTVELIPWDFTQKHGDFRGIELIEHFGARKHG